MHKNIGNRQLSIPVSFLLSSETKVGENNKSYSRMFQYVISVDSPENLTLDTI